MNRKPRQKIDALGDVEEIRIKIKLNGQGQGAVIDQVAAKIKEAVPTLFAHEPTSRRKTMCSWSDLVALKMTKFKKGHRYLTVDYDVWHVKKSDRWGY